MNIYDAEKWGVHLLGVDNVFAAKDFEEAVKKCNEINNMIIAEIKPDCIEPYPMTWAQVSKWNDIASHEHNSDETDWNSLF